MRKNSFGVAEFDESDVDLLDSADVDDFVHSRPIPSVVVLLQILRHDGLTRQQLARQVYGLLVLEELLRRLRDIVNRVVVVYLQRTTRVW